MLADQTLPVNRSWDHHERIKILFPTFSNRLEKAAQKWSNIHIQAVQAAVESNISHFMSFHLVSTTKLTFKWYSFSGAGYRLGQTNDDHVLLANAPSRSTENMDPIILRLWRQGFTINDSELRLYEDQKNREFLEYITKG